MMKAIQIQTFGGPEVMKFVELPEPVPHGNQVLVEVTSIGINYADTHQTENSYLSQQTLPLIPGMEIAGFVDGKRVVGLSASGGYAQKCVANPATLVEIPPAISDEAAVALFVQGLTAWHLIKTMGRFTPGETVVVHAAAGGVGSLAVQLAKLWGGKVIAVASTQEKMDFAESLGADVVLDADSDLKTTIKAANGNKGVDLVLEMVGGSTFDASLASLAPFGRIVTFGMASRTAPTPVHPGSLMTGSKTISGFWLADCFGKREMIHDVMHELFTLVSDGKLHPVIGATYPLSQAQAAHEAMLARTTRGKITLNPAT